LRKKRKVSLINIDEKKKEEIARITNIFVGNPDPRVLYKKIKIFEGEFCKTFMFGDGKLRIPREDKNDSRNRALEKIRNSPNLKDILHTQSNSLAAKSKRLSTETKSQVKDISLPQFKHIEDKKKSVDNLKNKFGIRLQKLPKIGYTQFFNGNDFYYGKKM
jgi:hypothetical protein